MPFEKSLNGKSMPKIVQTRPTAGRRFTQADPL
jgi:hypothetical protein